MAINWRALAACRLLIVIRMNSTRTRTKGRDPGVLTALTVGRCTTFRQGDHNKRTAATSHRLPRMEKPAFSLSLLLYIQHINQRIAAGVANHSSRKGGDHHHPTVGSCLQKTRRIGQALSPHSSPPHPIVKPFSFFPTFFPFFPVDPGFFYLTTSFQLSTDFSLYKLKLAFLHF
jgi:hypothetical protein